MAGGEEEGRNASCFGVSYAQRSTRVRDVHSAASYMRKVKIEASVVWKHFHQEKRTRFQWYSITVLFKNALTLQAL